MILEDIIRIKKVSNDKWIHEIKIDRERTSESLFPMNHASKGLAVENLEDWIEFKSISYTDSSAKAEEFWYWRQNGEHLSSFYFHFCMWPLDTIECSWMG